MRNILPWLLRYLLCDYNVFLIWFSIFLSSSNMVIYLGLFFLCANFYTLAYYSVLKLFPVVVQSSSHVCNTPGLPVPHHLPKFAQVHVYCFSDAIQPSHPLTPSSPLPSIFPSIRDFSNESAVPVRWPKYWSFSPSISPSN